MASLFIVGGAFLAATKLYKKNESSRLSFMAANNFAVFVRPHSPQYGNADAKVYLTEFFDPECESCRYFYPMVKNLLSKHEGKVQLVLRYAPFHGNSIFAIKILEAAKKQNKYWETLAVLFENQPQWGDHHNPRAELIWDYLPGLGLNIEKIKTDMQDPAIDGIIQQDIQDSKNLQVNGTPTFFVNGKALDTFSYETLEKMVEQAVVESY